MIALRPGIMAKIQLRHRQLREPSAGDWDTSLSLTHTHCFCNGATETMQHLYFECSHSSYIWKVWKLKLGVSDGSIRDLMREANKIKEKFRKKKKITILARMALCATIWHIWKQRNERVFQHKNKHKIMVFRSIYEDIKELLKTCHWKSSRDSHSLYFAKLGCKFRCVTHCLYIPAFNQICSKRWRPGSSLSSTCLAILRRLYR